MRETVLYLVGSGQAQWKTRAADWIGRVKGVMEEQLYDWLVRVQD